MLTLVKFLMQEGRFTYISSGLQLGLALRNTQSIPIGSLDIRRMYPMHFEEFLYANGVGAEAVGAIRDKFSHGQSLSEAMHSKDLDLFKKYLLVGGFPKTVQSYVDNLSNIPIEVKSGKDYIVHSALDKFLSIDEYNLHKAIVLSNAREVVVEKGITYLPIYYVMFLEDTPDANTLLDRQVTMGTF